MTTDASTSRFQEALSMRPEARELLRALLPLLAEGEPVARAAVTRALGWTAEHVSDVLRRMPNVELTSDGRIEGLGLTLRPTPHVFEVRGHRLYTWCALDALMFPAILGETARVTSPCAATNMAIRLFVTPDRVESVSPSDAVVSLVMPSKDCDLRASFCNQVSFFASENAASAWLSTHPGGVVSPVEVAYALAKELAASLLSGGSPCG